MVLYGEFAIGRVRGFNTRGCGKIVSGPILHTTSCGQVSEVRNFRLLKMSPIDLPGGTKVFQEINRRLLLVVDIPGGGEHLAPPFLEPPNVTQCFESIRWDLAHRPVDTAFYARIQGLNHKPEADGEIVTDLEIPLP